MGILGVETSFEEASQLAERFLLFRVSDNTVRKQTEGYGQAQATLEKEWKQAAEDVKGLEMREQTRELGMRDGSMLPWMVRTYLCTGNGGS